MRRNEIHLDSQRNGVSLLFSSLAEGLSLRLDAIGLIDAVHPRDRKLLSISGISRSPSQNVFEASSSRLNFSPMNQKCLRGASLRFKIAIEFSKYPVQLFCRMQCASLFNEKISFLGGLQCNNISGL